MVLPGYDTAGEKVKWSRDMGAIELFSVIVTQEN